MDAIDLLQQFGLNKYEAEAYYALLARGPMTGYEMGKHSGVPLSRSYEVLERLSQKGLALVEPGNVPRYAAEEPKRFLTQANAAFQARLEALTSVLAALSPGDRDGEFWVVSGRENILSQARSMTEEAQHAVEVALPVDGHGDVAEAIGQARSRGCRVFLSPVAAGSAHEALGSRAILL